MTKRANMRIISSAEHSMHVEFLLVILLLTVTALGYSQPLNNETKKIDSHSCICKSCSEKSVDVECRSKFSAREIQSILSRMDFVGDLFELHLRISSPTVSIPANLLSGRRFNRIFIHCGNDSALTQLRIDPNAFRTTSHRTDIFRIFNCDLIQQTDFAFLTDFVKLTSLSIQSSSNIQSFEKLPSLPNLKSLTVFNCTGLEKLSVFPSSAFSAGFKELDLALNMLNDANMEWILNSIVSSSSARTLDVLRLSGNRLTHIPNSKILSSLTQLSHLYLDGNTIPSIHKGSLDFCSQMPNLRVLNLMNLGLMEIEPKAFKYVSAKVHLDVNNLTRFESSVYKQMLERSVETGRGGLTFTSNLVDCSDCRLGWLIRNNRNLLSPVQGTCVTNSTNSVRFEDVDISDNNHCGDITDYDDSKSSSWFYFFLLKLVGFGL